MRLLFSTERKSSILNFITLLNESEKRQSQACKWRVYSLKYSSTRSQVQNCQKRATSIIGSVKNLLNVLFSSSIHSANSKSSIHVSIAEWLRYFAKIFWQGSITVCFSLSLSFFLLLNRRIHPTYPAHEFPNAEKKSSNLFAIKTCCSIVSILAIIQFACFFWFANYKQYQTFIHASNDLKFVFIFVCWLFSSEECVYVILFL